MENAIRKKLSPEKIGKKGEAYFDYIMAASVFDITTPVPDIIGVDRQLKEKVSMIPGDVPFDKMPIPRSCVVQVKTIGPSSSSKKTVKLTVSQAQKLVHTLDAAFIYVVILDENYDISDVYCVHVEGEALYAIMKKLRETSESSQKSNKTYMYFNFRELDHIGMSEQKFTDYILEKMGKDIEVYVENKKKQRNNFGYEDGRIGNFSCKIESSKMPNLIDFLRGNARMQVTNFRMYEHRFGIALPDKSTFDPTNMYSIQLKEPKHPQINLIIGNDGGIKRLVTFDVVCPILKLGFGDPNHSALLSRYVDLIHEGGKVTCVINKNFDRDPQTLRDLIVFFEIIKIVNSGDVFLRQTNSNFEEITLKAEASKTIDLSDFQDKIDLLQKFLFLKQHLSLDDTPIILDEIIAARHQILFAYDQVFNVSRDVEIKSCPKIEAIAKEYNLGDFDILFLNRLFVGSEIYAYCYRLPISIDKLTSCPVMGNLRDTRFVDITPISSCDEDYDLYVKKMLHITQIQIHVP